MQSGLRQGMFVIFSANILNLVFNLLTNFLLPKYLSIDSYAAIKTFQLYVNYVGVFSLGYADGMYLNYGGKELSNVDQMELKNNMMTYRTMIIVESAILIPLAFLYQDKIILAFTFTIIPKSMSNYFKNLYQAVGKFKLYGKILNWTSILTFVVNILLLFIVRTDSYFFYLILYAVVDFIIWFTLEWNIKKTLNYENGVGKVSIKTLISNIKSGFLLMLGNFSNILLSSMDRWFVKIMMDLNQFSFYSFAVSMEGFLNIAITPITTTLYNYFCNHRKLEDVLKVREYILIIGTVIVSMAFPAKFVIEVYLKNYMGAVNVLFILFATQMIYIVIKGIYVNLYKAERKQNLYFIRLISILIIGAILNYLFVRIYPFKEAFSYGTLVAAFIWLIFSIQDFKKYKFQFKEWVYLITEVIVFIVLLLVLYYMQFLLLL